MGQRARGRGLSNAVVKGRHAEAAKIGQAVYRAARDLQDEGGYEPVPLPAMAALTFLAQFAGPGIVERFGLATGDKVADERLVEDVGAYLTAGYLSMIAEFSEEHFTAWRGDADEAVRLAAERAAGR